MRIVLHGQQAFGSDVLDRLIENKENIVAVCAAPDKENGKIDPLVENATKNKIPVFQPSSWKTQEAYDLMKSFDADLCVMAYVTLIVPSNVLNLPKLGSIQYHPSLLPMHRGPSSINWPINNGSDKTGITIFWPDDGLDTGPILLQKECEILQDETLGELYFNKLFPMGIDGLEEAINLVRNNNADRIEQDLDKGSYESWFGKTEAKIDWSHNVQTIYNKIRASDPQPGAWTLINGVEVKFYEVGLLDQTTQNSGEILSVHSDTLIIGTKDGAISIKKVRVDGKKVTATEFINEYKITIGTICGQ